MSCAQPWWLALANLAALAACGGDLRAKPQFECEPSRDLPGVVCSDGLIGSCVGGRQRIAVCGDTTVCEASWQQAGAYKCGPNDALGDSNTTIYAKDEQAPSLEAATLRVIGGVITPGGRAQLSVSIRNTGPVSTEMVSGMLSTTHPGATVSNGSLYFGDIGSGATACGSIALGSAGDCDQTDELPQLEVAATVAGDTSIQLDLTVSDADPKTFTLTVSSD
ncbi:MAG TPA: hypothetical protein VMF89_31995 [Polyangiales bacterium]|nr:hypothetical protein [Polyangiales bacterium]